MANMRHSFDYYPFGMLMPGRHASSDSYRYGFNGMEKDDEVSGQGNSYTTEFRQYDTRLGRWKSLDPLMAKFPYQSAYAAFDNNPIYFNDPKGLAAGGPGDRKLNTEINKGLGDASRAGTAAIYGTRKVLFADVSTTNGNTNNPEMAFPSLIAKANGLTLQKLYDLNPNLKDNAKLIGQGQLIYLSPESPLDLITISFSPGSSEDKYAQDVFLRKVKINDATIPIDMISITDEINQSFNELGINAGKNQFNDWKTKLYRITDKPFEISTPLNAKLEKPQTFSVFSGFANIEGVEYPVNILYSQFNNSANNQINGWKATGAIDNTYISGRYGINFYHPTNAKSHISYPKLVITGSKAVIDYIEGVLDHNAGSYRNYLIEQEISP